MPRGFVGSILALLIATAIVPASPIASAQGLRRSTPAKEADPRDDAVARLPLDRLTPAAKRTVLGVVQSPTLFRRLPTQTIDCDPQMFVFLVRHPEVLVGIWDVMGVTEVQAQRIAPYQLKADDRVGTECVLDLVYGDAKTHLFVAGGTYSGRLSALPISGSGVFVLHSRYTRLPDGQMRVTGTLDCFIQLDNLGADLLARTLSGVIGRTADNNFRETASFIAQVSGASARNPQGVQALAGRLPQVDPAIRSAFAEQAEAVSQRAAAQRTAGREATLSQRTSPSPALETLWE